MTEVMREFGLERADEGEWFSSIPREDPSQSVRFDGAIQLGSGSGLFAKAHATLLLSGSPVAHLKVALTDHAAQAMTHESAVLDILRGRVCGAKVPAAISRGRTDEGVEWSVQEVVGSKRRRLPPRALLRLTRAIGELDLPCAPYPTPGVLAIEASGTTLPSASSHGDFIPSNMLTGQKSHSGFGSLGIIDWEWASSGALAGADVCHFFLAGALSQEMPSARRISMGLWGARTCLAASGLKALPTLLGYLSGMADFYSWCADQVGASSSEELVVRNVARVRTRLQGEVQ